ncbi:hypothetical protein BDF19DRAFT_432179 [Syncephalis fuscata]|nr:hypothetical protein BDF19DRAFT_432179 [Syncephalis fuscata]
MTLDETEWQWLDTLTRTLLNHSAAELPVDRLVLFFERFIGILAKQETAHDCARHFPQAARLLTELTRCRAVLLHPRTGPLLNQCLVLYSRYGTTNISTVEESTNSSAQWARHRLRSCNASLNGYNEDAVKMTQACGSGTRPLNLMAAQHMLESIGKMLVMVEIDVNISTDIQLFSALLISLCKHQCELLTTTTTLEQSTSPLSYRLVRWLSIEHIDVFCNLSVDCHQIVYHRYPLLMKEQMAKHASVLVTSSSSSSSDAVQLLTLSQLTELLHNWPLWHLSWCQLVIEFADWQLVRIARCWIRLSLLSIMKSPSMTNIWLSSHELLIAGLSLAQLLHEMKHIIHSDHQQTRHLFDRLLIKVDQTLKTCSMPTGKCSVTNTLVWLLLGTWPAWQMLKVDTEQYTQLVAWMLVPLDLPAASPSSSIRATTRQLIHDVAHFINETVKLDGERLGLMAEEAIQRVQQVVTSPCLLEWTLHQCITIEARSIPKTKLSYNNIDNKKSTSSSQSHFYRNIEQQQQLPEQQHPFLRLLLDTSKTQPHAKLVPVVLADILASFA